MAFGTLSKIFTSYITDVMNRTSTLDVNSNTLKVALFGNTGTPDQTVTSANSAYNAGQWVTGNETSNGGWSAGGLNLASVTSAFASNVYTFDAADTANGTAATVSPFGCLIYDSTATAVTNQGMCYLAFGGVQTVTSGTLTIVYNASGIMTLTL